MQPAICSDLSFMKCSMGHHKHPQLFALTQRRRAEKGKRALCMNCQRKFREEAESIRTAGKKEKGKRGSAWPRRRLRPRSLCRHEVLGVESCSYKLTCLPFRHVYRLSQYQCLLQSYHLRIWGVCVQKGTKKARHGWRIRKLALVPDIFLQTAPLCL